QAGCNAEMVRWLGLVLSEAGGGTDPVILPYDYVDINALGHVFEAEQDACSFKRTPVQQDHYITSANNHWAHATCACLHLQTFYCFSGCLQDKKIYVTGRRTTVKQQAAALSEQKEKPQQNATVKRNPSNADSQRYGKHRAEADAKRFQAEKEELEKKKERLRCQLAQLKTQRKELKEAMEKCTGGGKQRLGRLEERLHKLEDECRTREQERVELELKITEVKESLKKAQAGGPSLGITIDPKVVGSPPLQSPQVQRVKRGSSLGSSPEPSDTDMAMLPVNCAAMLKRKQNSAPQTGRGHVIQKAKEWEKKGT
uniref:Uncharacterized protein n=1 Tax=Petromyzon marinus TaxID=7757 RepID=S4RQK7_PETMA